MVNLESENNKIGLEYVGLPIVHLFSEKYKVVCLDINQERIDELKNSFDRTLKFIEIKVKEAIARWYGIY